MEKCHRFLISYIIIYNFLGLLRTYYATYPCYICGWVVHFHYLKCFQQCPNTNPDFTLSNGAFHVVACRCNFHENISSDDTWTLPHVSHIRQIFKDDNHSSDPTLLQDIVRIWPLFSLFWMKEGIGHDFQIVVKLENSKSSTMFSSKRN